MTFSARLLFRARPRFKRFGDADRFFALAERSRALWAVQYNAFTHLTEAIDGDGNQTAVVDPDLNTTTSAFDADDRLTETVSPAGGTAFTYYDADGNVTETIAANGSSIVTSYDADDRVTQALWYEDDVTVDTQHQAYDNDGNLLTASNVNGTYSFSYDADDRLTQVSEPFAETLQYAYDGDGNQTQVVDSFGGTQTSVYDLEDQLATREYTGEGQNLRVDFTYTAEGQIADETDYDNLAGTSLVGSTTYGYDADQNVTNVVSYNASDAVIESFKYTYDRAGNVGSETDTQQGSPTTITYSYDDANQLTAAGTDGYSYDANGNRTMTGYTTGPDNELTSDGTYDYTYDAGGEEITKTDVATGDKWTYEYNPGGQLASAVEETSGDVVEQQVSYYYDVFSQLIETQTTVGDTTTTVDYAVDGWNPAKAGETGTSNFDVWATFTSGGSLTAREIQGDGIDQHLAYVTSGGIAYWYLTDHLGSTRAVVNNSGTVLDAIAYDAYGNISQSSPSSQPMYTWDGYDYDAATGYYDNHARVYDPKTGRWISQDPLGFDAGDSNLYRYVSNSPMDKSDPGGLLPPGGSGFGSAGGASNPFGRWTFTSYARPFKAYDPKQDLLYSGVSVGLNYYPNLQQIGKSQQVAFVQIVRIMNGNTPVSNLLGSAAGEARITPISGTTGGWRVDRAASLPNQTPAYGDYGWYGLANNGVPLPQTTASGSGLSATSSVGIGNYPKAHDKGRAWLRDAPRIYAGTQATGMEFETFAITFSETKNIPTLGGTVLSGYSWAFRIGTSSVSYYNQQVLTGMTPEFIAAVANWDLQAAGDLPPKNTPNQQPLQGPAAPFVDPT